MKGFAAIINNKHNYHKYSYTMRTREKSAKPQARTQSRSVLDLSPVPNKALIASATAGLLDIRCSARGAGSVRRLESM